MQSVKTLSDTNMMTARDAGVRPLETTTYVLTMLCLRSPTAVAHAVLVENEATADRQGYLVCGHDRRGL